MDIELESDRQILVPANAPKLYQNYPNPFRKETKIGFELTQDGQAEVQILDGTGKVYETFSGEYAAGYHELILDGGNLPAGLLFYTIKTDGHLIIKKMIVIK